MLTLALVTAAQQSVIDWAPFIPVLNGLITTAAGIATAAMPVIAFYFVAWIRAHGIAVSQQAQTAMTAQAEKVLQMGIQYADSTVANSVHLDKVSVASPTVAKAASYAIAQAPALLKNLGYDVTTEEGQKSIVRMVTARLVPAIPPPNATVDVNVKAAG